ncbi:MAG: hypothetical protein IKE51_01970 [Solobacterium sp.]|nr:hypothetical protein [Solobacterium sp.]
MSKIYFFTSLELESFHSILPLMKEFVKRGIEVECYSFDVFRQDFEEAGIAYYSLDSYIEKEREKNQAISTIINNLTITKNCIRDLEKKIETQLPDYIVVDQNTYWGKLIAKKYDIPYTAYTINFLINRYTTKYSKNHFVDYIQMALGMSKVGDIVKQIQQLGYIINNPLNFLQVDDDETLVFIFESFQLYAETFGKNFHFVGPMKESISKRIPHAGKNIGIGNADDELKENYIKACEELEIHPVTQLEECDVYISKGKMEEVNDCIQLGIPLILYPQTSSEQAIAQRVVELGVGAMLRSNTVEDIKQTIPFILNNPQYQKRMNELSKESTQIPIEEIIQIIERKD